jgi:hypothetical protein
VNVPLPIQSITEESLSVLDCNGLSSEGFVRLWAEVDKVSAQKASSYPYPVIGRLTTASNAATMKTDFAGPSRTCTQDGGSKCVSRAVRADFVPTHSTAVLRTADGRTYRATIPKRLGIRDKAQKGCENRFTAHVRGTPNARCDVNVDSCWVEWSLHEANVP